MNESSTSHSPGAFSMIAYRDFVPQPVNYHGPSRNPIQLLKIPEFESLDAAVSSANAWIQAESIEVIHVETVVLPHVYILDARNVDDTHGAVVSGHQVAFWEQFVRVWYRQS